MFSKNVFLVLMAFGAVAFAGPGDQNSYRTDQHMQSSQATIVQWEGLVHSADSDDVELEFINNINGKTFDVVDSPGLERLDWNNHKARIIHLTAEKTPQFLFWGGNLIVKSFSIVKDAGIYEFKKPRSRDFDLGAADRR